MRGGLTIESKTCSIEVCKYSTESQFIPIIWVVKHLAFILPEGDLEHPFLATVTISFLIYLKTPCEEQQIEQ
jgi:hypothetical protein